jgi:hypothetical protein
MRIVFSRPTGKTSRISKKFQVITKVTEGRNASLADVLPAIDFLLDAFSQELTKAEGTGNLPLAAMVKCGWETLDKYFSLTDRAPVYVAAVVLHPKRTWQYFHRRWKEEWIPPAKMAVEELWKEEYKAAAVPALNQADIDLSIDAYKRRYFFLLLVLSFLSSSRFSITL